MQIPSSAATAVSVIGEATENCNHHFIINSLSKDPANDHFPCRTVKRINFSHSCSVLKTQYMLIWLQSRCYFALPSVV